MGYIYLVKNKLNGMKYVGQTLCQDINTRWHNHKKIAKSTLGRYLCSAYTKYGIENFQFQIICICFDEDCNKYEEEYIKKFNTMAPNGYNLREGGVHSKFSEETKQLQREATRRLMQNPERRMKSSQKGPAHPNYGKKYTDAEKEILRQKQKSYWANLSDEKRQELLGKRNGIIRKRLNNTTDKEQIEKKVRQYAGLKLGSNSRKKPIGKYCVNNILIETYESIQDASNKNNICYSSINRVCLNKYKHAGGFIWKFI